MSFEGKVILITGASSGIGAACSEYFANEGALLILVGRSAEKFEKVVEKIKENGVEEEPFVILADVTVDAERIISESIEKYGKLDILINNAGIANYGDIETAKMEDFDSIMATNVRGVFELTQHAVPHLIETKGNIINISSALGTTPIPSMIAYSMSKASINQFTRCLAIGLASKGVRVNCISPGFIDTEFHLNSGTDPEEYETALEMSKERHPLQRVGYPKDCVNAISFVAKDDSSFITGLILRCDGGLSTKGAF